MDISREQWLRIQQNSKWQYLVFHWVLSCAVPVAIVLPVIRGIIKGYPVKCFISFGFAKNVLLYVIFCSIISLIFGNRKWKKCKRTYANSEANK